MKTQKLTSKEDSLTFVEPQKIIYPQLPASPTLANIKTDSSVQGRGGRMGGLARWLTAVLTAVTVEPVMLVDGACKEAVLIYAENVQINKICSVKLGFSSEVCTKLTAHPQESVSVQREYSLFAFYNSIIMSVPPLIFVLFMGAWSDKYGRKIPLLMTMFGHIVHAAGYLLVNWQTNWPVEVLYPVTLIEALGGANVGILSSTTSYISDITNEKQRTSRMIIANSLWYLGGPVGTLVAALLIRHGGYQLPLALVLLAYIAATIYIMVFIPESHGPFAKEKSPAQNFLPPQSSLRQEVSVTKMISDFFNWRRVVESFKTALRKREGYARAVLVTVIITNAVRRMARGFFMYQFVRHVLQWDATDYSFWISYRNLLAALGSLFLVPLLSRILVVKDTSLIIVGALSIVAEYVSYGLVDGTSQIFLIWLGPVASIISNSYIIACRSMSTKLVTAQEKGRVSAVMAALNGLMPMAGYAVYTPIYYYTVDVFPAAQFFFGASINLLVMAVFIVLEVTKVSAIASVEDSEKGKRENISKVNSALHNGSSGTNPASSLGEGRAGRTPKDSSAGKYPPGNASGCHSNTLSDSEIMESEAAAAAHTTTK